VPDPVTTTLVVVACLIGSLDAFLALRGLPAKVRARRLHRRIRRWVRTCGTCGRTPGHGRNRWVRHLPDCPASQTTADVTMPPLVTSAVPNSTRRRGQL
jgi:hypothetical protein